MQGLLITIVFLWHQQEHTVRKWIYIGHKLPRTFDSRLLIYDINAYKKCLEKLILTKKKIHVPQLGLEPTSPQITSNYTKPRDFRPKCYNHWATKGLGTRGDKVIGVINNHSTFTIKVNFWPKKAIFDPFPPISVQGDLCQVDPFEKRQLLP